MLGLSFPRRHGQNIVGGRVSKGVSEGDGPKEKIALTNFQSIARNSGAK